MNNPPIAIGGIPVNAAVQESGAFALEANTTRDSTYLQILGALGDAYHAARLGGIGVYCRVQLEAVTGRETRCVVLGYLQRGGRPNAFDRMLATNFGACAVRALANGERGVMVALQAADVVTVPISEAIANTKTVPPGGQLVRTARDTGISFGAPDEDSYHPGLAINVQCG